MAGEPLPSPWWGVLAIAAGVFPIGAALLAEDAKVHAPRWLVAMIGVMFVLAGAMVIRAGRGVARRPRADVGGALLGAAVATGFLVLSGWALFFSGGPSAWGVSGSLPLSWLPRWATTALFYVIQGAGGLVAVLVVAFAWRQLYQAVVGASGSRAGGLQ